jgi:hypothetical protein
MSEISQQDILEGVRGMIVRLGRPDPGLEYASYVLERYVTPDLPISVYKKHLVSSKQFGDLMDFINAGADWIHANLYLTQEGKCVIGLSRGRLCGNPRATINVSIDSQVLRILEDE